MPRTIPTIDWNDEEFVRRIREAMERVRERGVPVITAQQQRRYNDTDEMPDERPDSCLNCGGVWHDHRGWACFHFWRLHVEANIIGAGWRLSELSDKDCYTTPDMAPRHRKKFSRVNPRKLRKLEREHLLSKESLLK